MEINYPLLQSLIKVLFIAIIPAVIIFFRLKGKMQTGTAVGLFISSFLLGLVLSVTVTENPARRFEKLLNEKKTVEARRYLKGIVQGGPDAIAQIDKSRIINPIVYETLRGELVDEYRGIATRYLDEYRRHTGKYSAGETDDMVRKLQHGLLLLGFAGHLGGGDPPLEKALAEALDELTRADGQSEPGR